MNIPGIGNFIKTNRKNFKITQKELAEALGVHWITVCRWETNTIIPSSQNLMMLQNIFGIRKDNLKIPIIKIKKNKPVLEIKSIKPLKKRKDIVSDKICKGIITNYKKGISTDNLAKFYNLEESTIIKIIKKSKIRAKRINYSQEYGNTSTKIAKVLGVTRQRVSQLAQKNKLFNKLVKV